VSIIVILKVILSESLYFHLIIIIVKEGDQIALLIIEKYCTPGVIEVKELKDLNDPE